MGLFDRIKQAFRSDKKKRKDEAAVNDTDVQEDDQTSSEQEALASDETIHDTTKETTATEDTTDDIVQADDTSEDEQTEVTETATEAETTEDITVDTVQADIASEDVQTEVAEAETAEAITDDTVQADDTSDEAQTETVADEAEVEVTEEITDATAQADITSDEAQTEVAEAEVSEDKDDVAPQGTEDSETQASADEEDTSLLEEKNTHKYDKGLKKTRRTFGERLNALLANFRHVDEAFFEDLEETLITSDVGFNTAMRLSDELRQEVKLKNAKKPQDVQNLIIEKLVDIYDEEGQDEDTTLHLNDQGLSIILFVGVNGAGKTTTIGKMAHQFKSEGKKVVLAAADTFRAGAINQLVEWGERSDVDVIRGQEGGDPASVVFDAIKHAKAQQADILLVDTAGRLQNKVNLMKELEKIKRIIQREEPQAPQEVLLVVDATTGQNAMNQAKQFKETTDVTGLVLTKLDGTAKGGMVLAIRNELHLPVKYVGLGEKIDDLAVFDPTQFVYGLFKDLWQEN